MNIRMNIRTISTISTLLIATLCMSTANAAPTLSTKVCTKEGAKAAFEVTYTHHDIFVNRKMKHKVSVYERYIIKADDELSNDIVILFIDCID